MTAPTKKDGRVSPGPGAGIRPEALMHQWIRYGSVFGVLCLLMYFSRFLHLPSPFSTYAYFLFGPLLVLFSFALYHFLRREGDSVLAQCFAIFNVLAGLSVTCMFVVQSLNSHHYSVMFGDESGTFTRDQIHAVMGAVSTVQAGIGMVWDIFIFTGTLFLALVFLRKPGLPFRIAGGVGLLLTLSGLILNFYAWPVVNPGTLGLVDVGPYMGIWYAFPVALLVYEAWRLRGG